MPHAAHGRHRQPGHEGQGNRGLRQLFAPSVHRSQTRRRLLTQLPLFPSAADGVWTAYCDGASRGNPGPASFGLVVVDPADRTVRELGVAIGINTNQVAEYEGLIRALEELSRAGARRARVVTDSQFVVKQFNGEYRAKDERMKALLARAKAVAARFDALTVQHVMRSGHAHNTRADALANRALDEAKKKTH